MKSFIKGCLGGFIGMLLFTIFSIIILTFIIKSIIPEKEEIKINKNSILHLKLNYEINDRTDDNPFNNTSLLNLKFGKNLGLNDLIKCFKKAENDSNIKAVFIEIGLFDAGLATIEELRNVIINFRNKTKKPVIIYADYYLQKAYYLSTAADKIYLNPTGIVDFKGLSYQTLFFKEMLKKVGLEPQIIRHGKYKNAIEPFVNDSMSIENEMQLKEYVNSLWNNILTEISEQRKISIVKLNNIADSLLSFDAENAYKLSLIDGLKYYDEVLEELCKIAEKKSAKELELISFNKYLDYRIPFNYTKKKEKIAILYATGQIDLGKNETDIIGSDSFIKELKKIKEDNNIKALVIRVNSPGGNAIASEAIWREINLIKKKIPVIVSMGDVAASGGYYIACPADVIVANKNTLTGSIGVFGLLWNAKPLFKDKIGINIDGVKTNKYSDIGTMFRKITPYEEKIIQNQVEKVYNTFVNHVMEGRKLTYSQVDSIGQGRIWSGIMAKQIKLIDEIGGLEKAIQIAKEKAKIKGDVKIKEFPEKLPFYMEIMKSLENENVLINTNKLLREINSFAKLYTEEYGIYTRLPFNIIVN
ncbi:MAG: signal peptide peptidase SppA [Bacteroidales bacterium]|nr:signal peptide peptidase SppA [Bacteroidales bacterium]